MRWMKHLSLAHDDSKLSALVETEGLEGYGAYWMVLELIAFNLEADSEIAELSFSELFWSQKLHLSVRKFRRLALSMSNLGLISVKSNDNRITIYAPNLLKYRDEYSKKSGHTRDKVPHSENRIQITEERVSSSVEVSTLEKGSTTATATAPSLEIHQAALRALESEAGQALDGSARQRITTALDRQGFEVAHLLAYIRVHSLDRCKNPIGALIAKAETFTTEISGFEFPHCLACFDTGKLAAPESPYAGKLPCNCPAGQKARTEFRGLDEYVECMRLGKRFCAACANTGRTDMKNKLRSSVKAPCGADGCEAGRLAREIDERAISEQLRQMGRCLQCFRGEQPCDECAARYSERYQIAS